MNKFLPPLSVGNLVVDLGAIVKNWQQLNDLANSAECSAVVKANAYGLGLEPVALALSAAGCRSFFVASVEEGSKLRLSLGASPQIYVLNGVLPGTLEYFVRWQLIPVLNSVAQLSLWKAHCLGSPCAAMVDTGMTRLGLSEDEALYAFCEDSNSLNLSLLLSHYACSDDSSHPMNKLQLTKFKGLLSQIQRGHPQVRASLASTAGIYLGEDSWFDLVRPGIGLYGGSPSPEDPMGHHKVVTLELPVVQLRRVSQSVSVGYGATKQVPAGSLLATVFGGYADGLLRSLSNNACGYINGVRVPLVGRVSMDYCVFDVSNTDIDEGVDICSLSLQLLGDSQSLDELANSGSTIGYEILTSLGDRYHREYID